MGTKEKSGKTKKEIRECRLRTALDNLSVALFPPKDSRGPLEDYALRGESLENDFEIQRWQWEGGT
jgi:hypothetical protein